MQEFSKVKIQGWRKFHVEEGFYGYSIRLKEQ